MVALPTAETVSPRRAHTRHKLMDAAGSVFAEKGILAASVEEICERAGFTRGAFYSNFDSKDDLCLHMLRELAASNLSAAEAAIKQVSGPGSASIDEVVDAAINAFIAAQPSNRESLLLMLEIKLYAIRNHEITEAFNEFDREATQTFTTAISEVIDRMGLKLAVPAEQALFMLHAVHDAAATEVLLNRPEAGDSLARGLKSLLLALLR